MKMEKRIERVIGILAILFLLFGSAGLVSAESVEELCGAHELFEQIMSTPLKPAAMVASYELTPETLMPGDDCLLTITLENVRHKAPTIMETGRLVGAMMDSREDVYIRDAGLSLPGFDAHTGYSSAMNCVIGVGQKVDLPFKIKVRTAKEGVHMIKFYAYTENMECKQGKNLRYYVPVVVSSSSLTITPVDASEERIKLEVTNDGMSKIDGVAVVASNINGIELQKEKVLIGKMGPWESAVVEFNIHSVATEEQEKSADFRVVYYNWVNKHESKPICVKIPYHLIGNGDDNERQPLTATQKYMTALEEKVKDTVEAMIIEEVKEKVGNLSPEQKTEIKEKVKDAAEAKIPGFGLITTIFMLVVVVYLKRKRAKGI
jgi:hypothetical protein